MDATKSYVGGEHIKLIAKALTVFLMMTVALGGVGAAAGANNVVLPAGEEMSDEQLAKTEGKGLAGAVTGAIGGALTGYGEYLFNYLWDRYIDRSPVSWSWSDAAQRTIAGAATCAAMGALAPTP